MRKFPRIIMAVIILGLILPPASFGASLPDFQVKNLSNGMKMVYRVIPEAKKVTFRMVVPVGMLFEQQQQHGISHLLEHLIFRGNAKYSLADLHTQIDDKGGYYNGLTGLNRTEYYLEMFPGDFMSTLPMYLDLIFNPGLAESSIKLEKKIISVENELRNIPGNTFFMYLNELTQYHLDAMMNSISRTDLVNYHNQFYLPGRTTAIITGAFNPDEVARLLSNLKNSATPSDTPDWLYHDTATDIVLDDHLNGEEYQILFGFDLKQPGPTDLMVAKILPYILQYESRQYDYANDRPLDYQIALFYLPGHFFLVFNYRDTHAKFSLDLSTWHQKNLERYCRYLQTKNFDAFLAWLSGYLNKSLESTSYDPVALNNLFTDTLFEPTTITSKDLGWIQRLSSNDIKNFVQQYLIGKYYQKIVVRAL